MSKARGHITKRNNGWCYRFSYRDNANNRRYKSAQGFTTRTDAAKFMTQAMSAIDGGRGVNPAKITVTDYLRDWFDEYSRAGNRKATTISEHRTNIEAYIVPMLGGSIDRPLLLGKLKHEMVTKFAADLLDHGRRGVNGDAGGTLSPKSVRNILGTLRIALDTARKRGHIANNPADEISLPRWERRDLQVWESAQFAHFLQVAADNDDALYALWRLVIATGMRRGELLGLRWIDVDLVEATITIKQARVSDGYTVSITTPKTKAGRRTIAIDTGTVVALAHLTNQQTAAAELLGLKPFELIATDFDGRAIKPTTLLDRFHAATKRANLPKCRIHDLRHSAAAYQLEQGVPVHIVAGRLGHANPATTLAIYAAFLPTADRDASNGFGIALDQMMRTKRAPKSKTRTNFDHDASSSEHHATLNTNEINGAHISDDSQIVPPLGFEPNT